MSIGLNILGDRGVPTEHIVSEVAQLRANYHLVMDNPGLAAAVQPHCKKALIYRKHHNDDNAQDKQDPASFVQERHAVAPPGAYLYLGNEPWATQKLADWTMAAMQECDRLGRKGVILNFSTGNPQPADIPIFKPCLRYARQHRHLFGIHEYFDVDWRRDYPWHVGRVEMWYAALGSEMPDVVVTEVGCCVGFNPLRGYLWGGAMNEQSYGTALADLSQQVYLPFGIDATIFARTSDNPNDDWHTFNPRGQVFTLVSEYNRSETVTQPNYGTKTQGVVVLVNATAVNVRPNPSTNGTPLGQLLGGEEIAYWTQPQNTWWQIEWNGQLAYTSSTYVRFDPSDAQAQWIQEMQVHNDAIADLLDNPPS